MSRGRQRSLCCERTGGQEGTLCGHSAGVCVGEGGLRHGYATGALMATSHAEDDKDTYSGVSSLSHRIRSLENAMQMSA